MGSGLLRRFGLRLGNAAAAFGALVMRVTLGLIGLLVGAGFWRPLPMSFRRSARPSGRGDRGLWRAAPPWRRAGSGTGAAPPWPRATPPPNPRAPPWANTRN